MFYRLKRSYLLRGWKQMPWVLVKRPYNRMINLSQDQFQVLLLCDGETDVTTDQLDETMQKTLQQFPLPVVQHRDIYILPDIIPVETEKIICRTMVQPGQCHQYLNARSSFTALIVGNDGR